LLLDESLAISSELGMRPLMVGVLSRWEILKAEVGYSPGPIFGGPRTESRSIASYRGPSLYTRFSG
jgi:hypothetical protein